MIFYNQINLIMIQITNRLSFISQQISHKFSTVSNANIQVQYFNHFAKVLLDKPKALNSLSLQMIDQFNSQISDLNSKKAFWIEGAGGKAFCAGGDVKTLFENRLTNPQLLADFFRRQFTLDYKITQMKSLQISNWDGIVMGGGVGISIFSPYRIATQNSLFAMPQTKIGFFTDVGASYFLSRLRGNIGYYLGLTGSRLKGQQVYQAGIANYYIPRQNIPKIYEELKNKLQNSADSNPKAIIQNILNSYHRPPKSLNLKNQEDIKYIFDSKSLNEVFQKLQKNIGNPFYAEVKKNLESLCPISVQVTFKDIQKAAQKNLRDCFITDYAISQHFMRGNDFFEGVRCTLVDKNDKPKWTHKHILDVKEEQVNEYFAKLENELQI